MKTKIKLEEREYGPVTCLYCNGKGYSTKNSAELISQASVICEHCNGTGKVNFKLKTGFFSGREVLC